MSARAGSALATAVVSALGLALAAGCGSSPSCEDAVANAAKVSGQGQDAVPELIARCKREGWSEAVRSCVKAARDPAALDRCRERRAIADEVDGYNTYIKKARRSEAEVNLASIQHALEAYLMEFGTYPVGKARPTPPPGSCCRSRSGKCEPDPSLWKGAPWNELMFSVDEPHYYSYGYQSNGKRAEVVAIGDLDCDETMGTFTLACTIDGGCSLTSDHRLE